MALRVVEILRFGADDSRPVRTESASELVLAHDDRTVRRRTLTLSDGRRALLDLVEATRLDEGDVLVLSTAEHVRIKASEEDLYEVRGRDQAHLVTLAWHIGNRHLPAELGADRIFILEDHVMRDMLERLDAVVSLVRRPFSPALGAYAGHSHDKAHEHDH